MTSQGSDERNTPKSGASADYIDVHGRKGVQIGDRNTHTNTLSLRTDRVDQINLVLSHGANSSTVTDNAEAVAATVTRHRRRNQLTRPPIMAAHPSAALLVNRLRSPDGRDVDVVHGRAGSGKSTVVTNAVQPPVAPGPRGRPARRAADLRQRRVGQPSTATADKSAARLSATPARVRSNVSCSNSRW